MKKSTLIMILCLVLAVAIGVGSTLAYLTDTDADKNVMTVGRVSVVQNEQQRVEENGEFTDELEPFVNDKMLLPVTDRNGTTDNVTIGDHELELKDKYNNYIDKIVTATNTSNVDVYLRTFVALPTGIHEESNHWHEYDAAADVWLHWNLVDDVYTHYDLEEVTGGDFYITVDGVEYEVWQFTHKAPVAPEETTYPVIRGLFMDKRVDMDEEGYYITLDDGTVHRIGNFLDEDGKMNVLVLTQAVQADGFDSADSALTQAFPYGEDNANVEKWFIGWTEDDIGSPGDKNDTNNPPVFSITVYNAEELYAAIGNYDQIMLGANIEAPLTLDTDVELLLNGNTLTGGIINEGDLTISGGVISNATAGLENHGNAEVTDVTMNAGDPANYAAISNGAGETTYENFDLTSGGGGVAAANGAQVTFKSGSVAVNSASTSGRYVFYAEGEGSVITIEDGEFSFSKTLNQKRAYIYAWPGTTVYVKGGTFGPASTRSGYTAGIMGDGTVIITGGTFGFDPTPWVESGYTATKQGSNWIVSAEN